MRLLMHKVQRLWLIAFSWLLGLLAVSAGGSSITFNYDCEIRGLTAYDAQIAPASVYDQAAILTANECRNRLGESRALFIKFTKLLAAESTGPGCFMQVSESMSARAAGYQSRITGLPSGTGYVANGVKFDGVANGVLLDAKGPGYANFVKNGQFQSWWNGAGSFVQQAQRQLQAAGGAPIQWHFAEEAAANATRSLFQQSGIGGIEVIFTP